MYDKITKVLSREKIYIDEPMSKHTSFKVGGCADFFVVAKTIDEIKYILELSKKENIPLTVVGNGTNLLVKDGGIRGITLKPDLKYIHKENNTVYVVGSGTSLILLSNQAMQDSLAGLEFASGIPGSIGGGLITNAGAYGRRAKGYSA